MDRRLQLQDELEDTLGSQEVNFQPPESVKLKYPCICYSKDAGDILRANDSIYRQFQGYTVIAMSIDPDNTIAKDLMMRFTYCYYVRRFVLDNVYQDVLKIYY